MPYPKTRKPRTGDKGTLEKRKAYYDSCLKCEYCKYENPGAKDSYKKGLPKAFEDRNALLKHYNNEHPEHAHKVHHLFNEDELVECPVCKLKMNQITDRHLIKHGIKTTKEFLEKYPNTPMRPKTLKKKWSNHAKELNSNPKNGEKISQSLQDGNKNHKYDEIIKQANEKKKEKFQNGELIVWNKGLTKNDHPSLMSTSNKFREQYIHGNRKCACRIKGYFYSEKNKCEIPYRSKYELRAFKILENDINVEWYMYENIKIRYFSTDKKKHTYYPDIVTSDHRIIEIKSKWIYEKQNKNDNVFRKFRAATRYAKKNKYIFEVWTETELEEKEKQDNINES